MHPCAKPGLARLCHALAVFFDASDVVKRASLKSSDFQQALGTRPVSRTPHFALHALWTHHPAPHLSTGLTPPPSAPVDDLVDRLGLVVPKKQARRSVTRSLIRHQARESVRRHAAHALVRLIASDPVVAVAPDGAAHGAPPDLTARSQVLSGWVLRLTRGFDRQMFPSAASDALGQVVRQELDELWAAVMRKPREVRR